MAEAKVFPMTTFVSCLRGADASDAGVVDLLSFLTQSAVDADAVPFASSLSKAYIYEQSPELTKFSKGEIASLGQKVSIQSMGDDSLAQAQEVMAKVAAYKQTVAEQACKIKELEAEVKKLSGELAGASAKLKTFEAQAAQGDQKLEVSSTKLDGYMKKLEDLLAQIDKVKKEGVVVAGVAGAAGGAAAAAGGGDAGGAPAEAAAGEDFGFSGGASDPFADSNW